MVQLASHIVLEEVDAEWTLLGTLFDKLDRFGEMAADINPAWLSDQLARYMFDECKKLIDEGHTLSTPVVISLLPEDCGGVPRSRFYANARLGAVPTDQLGGLIATLKDRWARRELLVAADAMRAGAPMFDSDPYAIASETVLALDTINAAKAERRSGTIATATEALFEHIRQPAGLQGAPTGLRALDKRLNGYVRGQLYVFAGRPGMGKSAFMCSSLRQTAEAGYGVGIFSLEMTEEEIAARMIADKVDDPKAAGYGDILRGLMSDSEMSATGQAALDMHNLPLHIDDSPRLTFSEIAGRARQLKAKLEAQGLFLAVLCVDHMGLVTPSDRYRGNKVAEAGEVSGQARALAKELDCCVILLCQLSREVEKRDDKRPTMADLRWSGEIEQDAHVVAFLYREGYYLAQDPSADPFTLQQSKFSMDFLIRKNRNGEGVADVPLWCSIAHSMVRDAE
jgi:replicative DNA helicase